MAMPPILRRRKKREAVLKSGTGPASRPTTETRPRRARVSRSSLNAGPATLSMARSTRLCAELGFEFLRQDLSEGSRVRSCAEFAEAGGFFFAAGEGDDAFAVAPEGVGELDGGDADAAGGAGDEDGGVFGELAPLGEGLPCGDVDEGSGGGLLFGPAGGDGDGVAWLRRRLAGRGYRGGRRRRRSGG